MTEELKARIVQINAGTAPAGYKKTKVGIVPEEWKVKRLGEILTQRKTLMCVSDDAPLLSFTIEEGVIEPSQKKSNKRDFLIKDMTTKKFALTEVGDIIYNPANLKFGAIHRNNLRRGVVSPIYGIFYGNQDSRYVGYLLHNQRFIDYAKIYTEGTVEKLKTLKADTFLILKVALPPLPEQQKIAKILTAQDAVIALMQKQIELLQKQKKAFLQKMFPKKGCTVPEIRFAGFTNAWEQRKLSDTLNFLSNNTLSRAELSEDTGTYKNVHYGDVLIKFGEYIDAQSTALPYIADDEKAKKFESSKLQDGDIIIADTAEDEAVGKCVEIGNIGDLSIVSGLHTIPCRPKVKFAPAYLGFYLNSASYHDQLIPLMQGIKATS